jgi:alpha-methylacyl-CoA racemase
MLEGVRVLDLASVGPAARAARWLADYGADVVKVAPVPSAGAVQITPPFHSYAAHRFFRRVQVDLKRPEGREVFLRLARGADVVIESFRPGVVAKLGIDADAVRAVNPRLVYCSTSGYGQTGPRSHWAGHDLNYLAIGGFLDVTERRADGGPPIPGATVADSAGGGMHAVIAILAALVRRSVTNEGATLDVSVADGLLALMALNADELLAGGAEPKPGHNILTGRYACYDLYECADRRWLSVAAIEPHFWANLCRHLELERWIEHQTDDAAQPAIRADMRAAFLTRDRDAWVTQLAPADTCVAPVLSVAETVADEQFSARAAFVEVEHPSAGRFRQVAPVLAGQQRPESPVRVREYGETDTEELLTAAGYSDEAVARLREEGVIA